MFLETEPDALPPRMMMASLASSRLKLGNVPVTTTVRPSRVRGTEASRSSSIRTPAAAQLSTISLCQSTANHSLSATAMVGPTPSTWAICSSVALRMASMLPKAVASAREAVGPTCRMDSATSTRHSGCCLAFSSSANSFSVVAVGLDGDFAVPLV
ncbi:hypothetical protein D3C73_1032860 [compost metagenome]